jgi:hypothetical protein
VRRVLASLAAGLAMAACSSTPPAEPEPVYPAISAQPPPAPQPPPAVAAQDACGAQPLQSLIGRPRTEIPIPVEPDRWRVACTTCPLTQDYRPDRLNILFDADTGIIRRISCG